jgi:hypothetical protein
MKLILTDDDGVVLDSTSVTHDEWRSAQHRGVDALEIINSLQPGEDE